MATNVVNPIVNKMRIELSMSSGLEYNIIKISLAYKSHIRINVLLRCVAGFFKVRRKP